jgi:hypothetical protein
MTITILVLIVIGAALVGRLFGVKHIGSFVGLCALVGLLYSIKKDPTGTAASVKHIWDGVQSFTAGMLRKLDVFFTQLGSK